MQIIELKMKTIGDNMEKLEIPIYYYKDDDGNKVYDLEAMADEFENKLSELTQCVVMCSVKGD